MLFFLIASLFSCKKIGVGLTNHYNAIEARYKKDQNTFSDRLFMNLTYRSGILVAFPVIPYASRILRHCIKGKTSTLKLHSRYIRKRSTIVQKKLNTLKGKPDGNYKTGGFHQNKEWRMSFAFNPMNFTLSTVNGKRYATIWYDFNWPTPSSPKAADTVFPLELKAFIKKQKPEKYFKMNDGLVHVISDCPSYRVEQTWKLDKSWN